MGRWLASQSPLALMALRLLLVSNAALLTAVGGIALAFVSRPAAYVFATGCWLAAGLLGALVRFTGSRPRDGSRW